jgi:hypothetical protein
MDRRDLLWFFHELPKAIRDAPDRPPGGRVPLPPAVGRITIAFPFVAGPNRWNAVALRLSAWDTGGLPQEGRLSGPGPDFTGRFWGYRPPYSGLSHRSVTCMTPFTGVGHFNDTRLLPAPCSTSV